MSSKASSLRSSISPFRSRRSPTPPPPSKSNSRPSTSSSRPPSRLSVSPTEGVDVATKAKENVTVTVRFRPLSAREINKGDEIAWYADGDSIVRNEYNSSIAYGYDKVFGPATTTRHVYDVAAQHVVSGAMQGINGTVFAYGVTSSGKTHTMHGEQKSPGIIPLAVKDVFSIIQDTPNREFLLRVSYLEIYNEVINDLLDPIGQNLRIREDSQGTYVEGIKEEVVLSPAHALSLIASGEEHRHVGSNNFNLLSSRSHTIFTLTIESSPSGESHGDEDVTLAQLNLIDLAGSESSKTETTGLRRKEGSYINKSLLTLGTVISKLTDGKATHVPYRDSKLTRLLQSSLSGHGRVSLICTVTPASSNSEETHNTLKFAHRSKQVEIKASQNKIMDEKSLIKKYQKEISCLREELQQLKSGMVEKPYRVASDQDLVDLKLQLEAGQVKLQSRLEEEEQAKAALMGRIQRLTKLILVSTKATISSNNSEKIGQRRRHSFCEDELAYLPDRKREYTADDDAVSLDSEFSLESKYDGNSLDDNTKNDKKIRKRGMLGWLKMKKPDSTADSESSASGSPSCLEPGSQRQGLDGWRRSTSRTKGVDPSVVAEPFPERTQAGDLFSATVKGRCPPPTGSTIIDQIDLLREQVKVLAGEVALCTSSLKRLIEQAAMHPEDSQIQDQMQKLKNEIDEKKNHMRILEKRMVGSFEATANSSSNVDVYQIMSADNRVLQEQLQMKTVENSDLQQDIKNLKQQNNSMCSSRSAYFTKENGSLDETLSSIEESKHSTLKAQVLMQAAEIENLKQEKVRLAEEKDGLDIHSQKLAEEASYAKELAAAAAVELRNLAEEVTKLSYQNAKLTSDLATISKQNSVARLNSRKKDHQSSMQDENNIHKLKKEINARCQREASLEEALLEKDTRESELQRRIDESKQREEELEKELANMWVLVAKLRRSIIVSNGTLPEGTNDINFQQNNLTSSQNILDGVHNGGLCNLEDATAAYEYERRHCKELEELVSRLKGDDLAGLDVKALEELQRFHVEALSKICQQKFDPFTLPHREQLKQDDSEVSDHLIRNAFEGDIQP